MTVICVCEPCVDVPCQRHREASDSAVVLEISVPGGVSAAAQRSRGDLNLSTRVQQPRYSGCGGIGEHRLRPRLRELEPAIIRERGIPRAPDLVIEPCGPGRAIAERCALCRSGSG